MGKPRITLNKRGLRDMYRDHAIPECLRRGQQAAAAAGEGFVAEVVTRGKKAHVSVHAESKEAFREEAKYGVLTKAMGRLPGA